MARSENKKEVRIVDMSAKGNRRELDACTTKSRLRNFNDEVSGLSHDNFKSSQTFCRQEPKKRQGKLTPEMVAAAARFQFV